MKRSMAVVTMALAFAAASGTAQAARWGVDQYSTSNTVLDQLERAMGHPFQAWSVYDGLDAAGAYSRTGGAALRSGKMVFLNITSTHRTRSGGKRAYCWDNIAAGRNDNQLAAWANTIRNAGHQSQLIITFEHEPLARSSHQPKCDRDNGTTYKQAWAHVTRYLKSHGVTARWAFVAVDGNFHTAMLGDRKLSTYVPWGLFSVLGVDVYNRLGAWRTIAEKVGPFAAWRRSHPATAQMPVIVPELGVDSRHSGAATWITGVARALHSKFGSKLIAVNWNVTRPYGPQTVSTRAAWLRLARAWMG